MRWFHSIANSVDMNLGKHQETVRDREAWSAAVHSVVYMGGRCWHHFEGNSSTSRLRVVMVVL